MSSGENHNSTNGRTTGGFERNNYFYGKLLTVRDMRVEQAYHMDRLNTLSRTVTGHGAVCGLGVSVSPDEVEDDRVTVAVEPGVAVDCRGRVLNVDGRVTTSVSVATPAGDPPIEVLSVYLDYRECYSETVPVDGLENACEEDCSDNRILEVTDLVVLTEAPADDRYKSVPAVNVPPPPGDTVDERVLTSIARSYYDAERTSFETCDDDELLLLGTFTRAATDPPWETERFERGPVVYNNDMLYAAIARHVTNDQNPHQVGLEAVTSGGNTFVGVQGPEQEGGLVRLASANETLTIESTDSGVVTFTVTGGDGATDLTSVENRLDALERHALEKALRCKLLSFRAVTERFSEAGFDPVATAAEDVAQEVEDALAMDGVFDDANSYRLAMVAVRDAESEVLQRLQAPAAGAPPAATKESIERYQDAFDKLDPLVNAAPADSDMLSIAAAQECVAKAAELTVPRSP